ncbi:MAG: inositol monophosphatase family protein [Hyphomicrobiales bacterium]
MTHTPASNLADLTRFALTLAEAAGRAILPHFRQNTPIDIKPGEHWDPVTEGDRAGERAIRHLIEKHHPSHGILGEEFGTTLGTSGLRWILDPVDGTRAFVIGLPTWATLIALYDGDTPLLGVMYQPFVDDLYYGSGAGSFQRHAGQERQIRVKATAGLAAAMVGTTAPHLYKDRDGAGFAALQQRVQTTRFGLDCYSFALLAAGSLDIAMDPVLQIYDIAALVPIMRGAGAAVGSWTDNNPALGGNVLCATSEALLDEARSVMVQSSR